MPDHRKYADRAEYLKKAVVLRRKAVRTKLIEYKGGQCLLCGYNKCIDALDLHHKDASQKDFGISSGGLHVLGNELNPKQTNASYYVQIATERYMQNMCSLHGKPCSENRVNCGKSTSFKKTT